MTSGAEAGSLEPRGYAVACPGRGDDAWCLYLDRCVRFLERNREGIAALIAGYARREAQIRALPPEAAAGLYECALGEMAMRAAEYRATVAAAGRPGAAAGLAALNRLVRFDSAALYGVDINGEYRAIVTAVRAGLRLGLSEEEAAGMALGYFLVFPGRCLLAAPEKANFLPGYFIARAVEVLVRGVAAG